MAYFAQGKRKSNLSQTHFKQKKPQIYKLNIRALVALKKLGMLDLDNQHCISVSIKLIFFLDRFSIGFFHKIVSREGRNHHH